MSRSAGDAGVGVQPTRRGCAGDPMGSSALTVVSASGGVDAATIRPLCPSAEQGEAELVEVDEIDVTGYVALLNADRKMRERGGEVVIACSRPGTRHTFTRLDPRGRLRLYP